MRAWLFAWLLLRLVLGVSAGRNTYTKRWNRCRQGETNTLRSLASGSAVLSKCQLCLLTYRDEITVTSLQITNGMTSFTSFKIKLAKEAFLEYRLPMIPHLQSFQPFFVCPPTCSSAARKGADFVFDGNDFGVYPAGASANRTAWQRQLYDAYPQFFRTKCFTQALSFWMGAMEDKNSTHCDCWSLNRWNAEMGELWHPGTRRLPRPAWVWNVPKKICCLFMSDRK